MLLSIIFMIFFGGIAAFSYSMAVNFDSKGQVTFSDRWTAVASVPAFMALVAAVFVVGYILN